MPPVFPVQAFPSSTLNPQSATGFSPIFIYPIDPLYWWSSPYTNSLNTTLRHSLCKTILIHPHHISKPSLRVTLHPLENLTVCHGCGTHSKTPIHSFITLQVPYQYSISSTSDITNFHCPHSCLLCCIPCPCLWCICQSWENDIFF